MKIAIASDHGGFDLKEKLSEYMKSKQIQVEDLGCYSKESCDYPLIGYELSIAVAKGDFDQGVLICTTGVGMSITANKVNGIRAGLCHNSEQAAMSRQHNDTNVLVLGAKFLDDKTAVAILETWLKTDFEDHDRHQRRVNQMKDIERKTE